MVNSKKSTTEEPSRFDRINESTVRRVIAYPYMELGGLFLSDELLCVRDRFVSQVASRTGPL